MDEPEAPPRAQPDRSREPKPEVERNRKPFPGQRDDDDTAARIYPETQPGERFPSDPPEA